MKKHVFLFKAKEGKPDLGSDANRARFNDTLKKYEGRMFRIELMENKRTISQNSFYWFYLGIIERELGQDSLDCHEYFKRVLLPPKFIKVLGKEIKIPKSTTELSKSEMSEYMDKISAMTNVEIPNPQDVGYFVG